MTNGEIETWVRRLAGDVRSTPRKLWRHAPRKRRAELLATTQRFNGLCSYDVAEHANDRTAPPSTRAIEFFGSCVDAYADFIDGLHAGRHDVAGLLRLSRQRARATAAAEALELCKAAARLAGTYRKPSLEHQVVRAGGDLRIVSTPYVGSSKIILGTPRRWR